ncbi:UDP-N-acetylmuramate:L-alanyl-gamma-D-glutamyl-meso-diaminopimelate ligase [Rhodoferax sp. 4810]|uniref:UDP-N-acetylmuramate--L-alanyl-gamma-D-glutamyl-meso-2,6-diaminoheptandioate ligase n=1 Tax=Thiospirillum jenense TaxID=1653858 RepID=A0A839H8I8_9GAMM|nr:UDP-N-acetylmuramate:L-alanyl-gamma-D-glutamyl-meso-diaminopimelate ligase [Thiospirillum jenense]MBB1072972.1 UDP-N-acetylmuramate:L-alanyl-gamma-D-glutamyl-meso-diaminopimelate ligase [Rhodoferax jenense]MBB1124920.1 UDP-N-acetylmuramate:L-alanyl-gamma-D-glutamyl-meso-diaminopimelate ligase [Thiospirillum jenense]
MHLHILGICGTFMGGIALLARQLGHQVTGSDANVYPPMSTQLTAAGIALTDGYAAEQLQLRPDVVVVGNTMKRGVPVIEALLDSGLRYVSGPQWLAENLLHQRHVLAVAGTHGKTTTASVLAWLLESAGLQPGFLIGGVPRNFGHSAQLGSAPYFVVEADEYDTAFFDKRSKFIHYRPRTLIINNIEFDHADIFDDLGAIQRQFHHLIRTVPGNGCILHPCGDAVIAATLAQGCWTPTPTLAVLEKNHASAEISASPEEIPPGPPFAKRGEELTFAKGGAGSDWSAELLQPDGSQFAVYHADQPCGVVNWSLCGRHNVANGLAAIAAAAHIGIAPAQAITALAQFRGVARRLELRGEVGGVRVYDDFAHHPTAIATTLDGLRQSVGATARVIAILEPRSNTMRLGVHADSLAGALQTADLVYIFTPPDLGWDAAAALAPLGSRLTVASDIAQLVAQITAAAQPGDQLLVMSNGGFQNIHQRLLTALAERVTVNV